MKKPFLPEIKIILTSITSGLLCNFIWLFEIVKTKGWPGLNWISGYMHSVFFIIPITVGAFILSINKFENTKLKNKLIAFTGLTIISLVSFETSRELLYTLNSRFLGHAFSQLIVKPLVIKGVVLHVFIYSFGYYYLTNKFLAKTPKWAIFMFLTSIPVSIVYGLITINLYSGFGTGKTFIDSVKMGYPIFWLNIFLGVIAIIIRHHINDSSKNYNNKKLSQS